MTKSDISDAYQTIWTKYANSEFNQSINSDKLLDRGFVFQHDEDENECDLLFVGINPAFSSSDSPWRDSYSRPLETDEEVRPYFKPFVNVSKELREEYHWRGQWTHIDIFAFRETDQKRIERDLLRSEDGIQFLYEQLMIARKRILHIKPKVIVISNALVRMFTGKERGGELGNEYGVWMNFRFEFDHAIGTDVIVEPKELKGTYVFFTSMLSGQRALDNGSRERLTWHIARALKNRGELPSFFNYADEETDNGYESIQDFFISWALRCSHPKYKNINPLIVEYSQRILHALIETTNIGNDIHIPAYEERENYEIIDVKTWRQWKFIDLIAEVHIKKENGETELIVLNIENKWYSPLKEHQLTQPIESIKEYYNGKNYRLVNIALFCDEEKKSAHHLDMCEKHGYVFQSVEHLISHRCTFNLERTRHDLFDTYWIDSWYNTKPLIENY